ncbi:flagellar motor switch protein FliM [Microbacterium phyllosphaerae]|uniref:flagellar motor switch protein FliM n=1 Tax=Microbacterium phyllosphaerae TaxID=124798 RepID=UPI00216900D0|nr:flagellar motor switch protein FliM [Microbacterium phyllosphaerae]MCS3444315.1 flagellar motor switch protein FliM [Microbacterium phyllosphaerae]
MTITVEETPMTAGAVLEDTARHPAYDFGRPAQLGRESTRHLEAAFESFARLWSSQLTDKIRVRAHLALESVDLVSYEEYSETLPGTTAMVAGAFADRDEPCVVQFGLDTALLWVVQMMGGRSTSLPEARTFTPIELALVRNLMEGTFEHLHASLDALLPGAPRFSAVHYNPQYMQVIAATAAVIVARYTMRLGDSETTATVMLPASAVVDRLAATGSDASAAHTAEQTLEQLRSTPLEITLRLAPITIGAGEILDLAPGDLLRLPHPETRPYELVAGGTRIALATPGSRGSRLTCKITTTPEETH